MTGGKLHRGLLAETPEERQRRKLAEISATELEGWIAEARARGDRVALAAGLARQEDMRKGRTWMR